MTTNKPTVVVLIAGDFAKGQRVILPESFIPRDIYLHQGDFARGQRVIRPV